MKLQPFKIFSGVVTTLSKRKCGLRWNLFQNEQINQKFPLWDRKIQYVHTIIFKTIPYLKFNSVKSCNGVLKKLQINTIYVFGNTPFSKLSIWSLVNDVRFLCSFLFNRSLAWSSSGPTLDPAFELSPEFVSSELTPSRSVTVIR